MSEHDHLARARDSYEAFAAGDRDAIEALFAVLDSAAVPGRRERQPRNPGRTRANLADGPGPRTRARVRPSGRRHPGA